VLATFRAAKRLEFHAHALSLAISALEFFRLGLGGRLNDHSLGRPLTVFEAEGADSDPLTARLQAAYTAAYRKKPLVYYI
jgi:hypothetical protein